MRTLGFVGLLSLGILIVSGGAPALAVASTPEVHRAAASGVPEVRWQLAEAVLADGTVYVPDDPALYTLQFLSNRVVIARADCNQLSGSYELDGDALSLVDLVSTLVGCPEGSLGTDYSVWLELVTDFELTDDALILGLDDGGRLRFAPALTGVSWEWQRFLGGNDSMVTPDHPDHFTLQFQDEPDDRVLVRADCNYGSGSFEVAESAIRFDRIGLSRAYCGDESLDHEFLRLLSEVTSYTFLEGRLVLALPVDAGVLILEARALDTDATPAAEATPSNG
jgi:heat shock protein HslJ